MVDNWNREAKRLLKRELVRRDMNYKALVRALESVGVDADPKLLSAKINRGTFSLAFFLQCMAALGVDTIRLKGD